MDPEVGSQVTSMPRICLMGPKSWTSNFEPSSSLTCDIRVLSDAKIVMSLTCTATMMIPAGVHRI